MKILIRVDSSTRIGTGHMMRCLTLAEQLRAKKCDVSFVARVHPGNINSTVSQKGFSLTELPAPPHTGAPIKDADYPAWLGVTQDQDARETLAATEGNHFDWLVVDHYSLDAQWEAQMRAKARKIMVIDDLANRPHECDVLLDQNLHPDASTRYEFLIPPTASRFIGPQYALLRKEFHEAKKTLRKRTGEIKRVLVCMGGSDSNNVTGEVVGSLLDQRFSHLEIQVVVGPSNPHLQSIEAQIEGRGNFRVLTNVQNLAMLMAESDLAIGGGGSMLWERAYLELPSLVIPIAENQKRLVRHAADEGLVSCATRSGPRRKTEFRSRLLNLLNDQILIRAQQGELGQHSAQYQPDTVVDLVCGKLASKNLRLRPTSARDQAFIWHLERQAKTRDTTENRDEFNKTSDLAFGVQKIFDANFHLPQVVAVSDVERVAVLRFILKHKKWEVEIRHSAQHQSSTISNEVKQLVIPLIVDTGRFFSFTKMEPEINNLETVHESTHLFPIMPHGTGRELKITLLYDSGSWLQPWIYALALALESSDHSIAIATDEKYVGEGDICFVLGFEKLVSKSVLDRNKNTVVVHESALPQGRGWSPVTWQVLEGRKSIDVVLFECTIPIDSGPIYLRSAIEIAESDLLTEIREKQALVTLGLCVQFTNQYPDVLSNSDSQKGPSSYYRRRTHNDSGLDLDKSIREQWNLLRICDRIRYPAFFYHQGERFSIRVTREGE